MGSLRYGGGAESVEIGGRPMHHLRLVAQPERRAQQRIAFSWRADDGSAADDTVRIAPGVRVPPSGAGADATRAQSIRSRRSGRNGT